MNVSVVLLADQFISYEKSTSWYKVDEYLWTEIFSTLTPDEAFISARVILVVLVAFEPIFTVTCLVALLILGDLFATAVLIVLIFELISDSVYYLLSWVWLSKLSFNDWISFFAFAKSLFTKH